MQRDVVAHAHHTDLVIANMNSLVDTARSKQVPVIWFQHIDDELPEGSDGWQYVPELDRRSDEPLVHKNYGDSFEETDLESVLAQRGVGRLVLTGAQTDACIRSTLYGALARGYDAVLVGDAHSTEDMREWGSPMSPEEAIQYTNLYWKYSSAPGRTCDVVPIADVDFADA